MQLQRCSGVDLWQEAARLRTRAGRWLAVKSAHLGDDPTTIRSGHLEVSTSTSPISRPILRVDHRSLLRSD